MSKFRPSSLPLVALIALASVVGAPDAKAQQPAACNAPAAPPQVPQATAATVLAGQQRVDAERAKVSNTRYSIVSDSRGSYERTESGQGDKSKANPEEIRRAQIGHNQTVANYLRSGASQSDKDAVLKGVVAAGIRFESSFGYSEQKELNRHFNLGALPPEQAAERARLMGRTYSCLGKECPPDLSKPDAFAKKDNYGDLAAFFERSKSGGTAPKAGAKTDDPKWDKLIDSLGKNGGLGETNPRVQLIVDLDRSARDVRTAVIEHGLTSTDPSVRAAALAVVPAGPKFDPHENFARKLAASTGPEAKEGMKRLGELLRAKSLGQTDRFKHYVDTADLDRQIGAVLSNKDIVARINGIRDEANAETKASWSYKAQLNYVRSEDFWNRLTLQPDAAAKQTLAEEIAKIAVIDPQAAKDALGDLQDRFAAKMIDEMSNEELIDRMAAIETHLGGDGANLKKVLKSGLDVTKRGAKVASTIDAVKALVKASATRGANPEDAVRALQASGFGSTQVGKSMVWLAEADKHGKVSGKAAALGLVISSVDLANGKLGQGTKADVDAVLSVMKATDAYDAFAKWGAWQFAGKELAKDSAVLTKFAGLKRLGPAADIIGGVVDTTRGFGNLHAGNADKAYWQFAGAAGQFTTAAGTIVILAGASGPGAPIVVLVGTVVVIIAKVGEWSVEKEPEVEFLRSTGLLATMPAEVQREKQILESQDSLRRDAGIHRMNLSNAKFVLDRPIGAHPANLERARQVRYNSEFGLSQIDSSLARLDRELAEVRAKMNTKGINPKDWDGFSPAEIRARKDREERWRRAMENYDKNASSTGIPLGR